MRPNPICKKFTRMDWGRPVRQWVAVCPHCGETIGARVYYGLTRKQARSFLHHHVKTEHAGPGLETAPS